VALRDFLATKVPDAPAFKIPTNCRKAATMFRADVEAAGIEYRDESGRVADFHSVRHTFITNLANGGIHPKTAQTLARHCSFTLTMNRYSHTPRAQETEALTVLPDLSERTLQALQSTGTTDAQATNGYLPKKQNVLASCLALSSVPEGSSVDSNGPTTRAVLECENAGKTAVFSAFLESRRDGRAVDCTGLENRRGVSHRGFESLSLRCSAALSGVDSEVMALRGGKDDGGWDLRGRPGKVGLFVLIGAEPPTSVEPPGCFAATADDLHADCVTL
jgi:hypothetical protein